MHYSRTDEVLLFNSKTLFKDYTPQNPMPAEHFMKVLVLGRVKDERLKKEKWSRDPEKPNCTKIRKRECLVLIAT